MKEAATACSSFVFLTHSHTHSPRTHSELDEVSGAGVDGEEGVAVTKLIHAVTTHPEGQPHCVTAVRVHHLHLQETHVTP